MPRKKKEELPEEAHPVADLDECPPETDAVDEDESDITFEVSGEIISETSLPPEDEVVDTPAAQASEETQLAPKAPEHPAPRGKSITSLNLRKLDRDLSPLQRQEWEAIYASHRAKSLLTGTVMGIDSVPYTMRSKETGETQHKTLHSLAIVSYRVKVLIPETELWLPGEERPQFVLPGLVGSRMDYVIISIDREGEFAIGSRRMAMNKKRRYFAGTRHEPGQQMQCRIMAVGPKLCTVECHGFDISLTQRELSYSPIPDLREKFHPGQALTCLLDGFDSEGRMTILVKEVNPNPFEGADLRHPIGSRRHAVISGKYAGGVFCTLADETACLCLYSSMHADADFQPGDSVMVYIAKYDYERQLIYGRIMAKW